MYSKCKKCGAALTEFAVECPNLSCKQYDPAGRLADESDQFSQKHVAGAEELAKKIMGKLPI